MIKQFLQRGMVRAFGTAQATGPYDFLQVKRRLNLVQYRETQMQLSEQSLRVLSPERIQDEYIVASFFTGIHDQIVIQESANQVLDDQTVNYPRNCWSEIRLPFSTNREIRQRFARFYTPSIRIGRILEMLDYIGSSASYKYIYSKRTEEKKATMVTACVDSLNFYSPINVEKDLIITAYPSFVGTSTIEIQLDLWQEDQAPTTTTNNQNGHRQLMASAIFLFAARNKDDYSKSYRLPKFLYDGEEDIEKCHMRYQLGLKRQLERKQHARDSIVLKAPNQQEIEYVHRFFTNEAEKEGKLAISETHLQKTLLMHTQDRNLHGKIFGGYIMREAFEIGWLAGYMHVGGLYPEIYHIDDFQFIQPVTVGDAITFDARVCFVQGNLLHVIVDVSKLTLEKKLLKTNDMHLTFVVNDKANPQRVTNIKEVYPLSYRDAMMMCDSKRRVNDLLF